jgi:hypothetical protein
MPRGKAEEVVVPRYAGMTIEEEIKWREAERLG